MIILRCIEHSLMYSRYPTDVLKISPNVLNTPGVPSIPVMQVLNLHNIQDVNVLPVVLNFMKFIFAKYCVKHSYVFGNRVANVMLNLKI